MTVVRALQAPTFPEHKGHTNPRKSVLTPYKGRFLKRWNAACRGRYSSSGTSNAAGTPGATPPWRGCSVCAKRRGCGRASSTRATDSRSSWRGGAALNHAPLDPVGAEAARATHQHRRTVIAHLQAQHSNVAVAIDLAQDFCTIVRERQVDRFDDWLARAVASRVAPLQRFATGLHAELSAAKAGIAAALGLIIGVRPNSPIQRIVVDSSRAALVELLHQRAPAGIELRPRALDLVEIVWCVSQPTPPLLVPSETSTNGTPRSISRRASRQPWPKRPRPYASRTSAAPLQVEGLGILAVHQLDGLSRRPSDVHGRRAGRVRGEELACRPCHRAQPRRTAPGVDAARAAQVLDAEAADSHRPRLAMDRRTSAAPTVSGP